MISNLWSKMESQDDINLSIWSETLLEKKTYQISSYWGIVVK